MSRRWTLLLAGGGLGAAMGLAISALVGNPLVWMGICTLIAAETTPTLVLGHNE